MKALIAILVTAAAAAAIAQAPPAAPVPATAPQDAPTPPPNYRYEPDNRRDPFVNLVNRGTDARSTSARGDRPDGVPGLLIDELDVRGILESRGGYIALVAAPNGRTYDIRPGDELLDGSVRTITADAVVFMQEVSDPLSLEKQREVRKPLRPEVK